MTHDQLIADAMRELTDVEQLQLLELELDATIRACANDQLSGEQAWRAINLLCKFKSKELGLQT